MLTLTLPVDATRASIVAMAADGRLPLPAVPRVVRRLIENLRDEVASMASIVAEIEQEPHLAARVLRMANSPFFGGRRAVGSIADAVPLVGTAALKTLVISGGLSSAFVEVPGINLREFWRDAQITAASARSLATVLDADREQAYLVGLLARVGHLIISQAFPAEMASVHGGIRPSNGAALALLERQACGLSHPEVGAAWMDVLGFPCVLPHAVAYQLVPPERSRGLDAVLWVATRAAEVLRDGLEPDVARLRVTNAVQAMDAAAAESALVDDVVEVVDSLRERLSSLGNAS